MSEKLKCDICGRSLSVYNGYEKPKTSESLHICFRCSDRISDLKDPGSRNKAYDYLEDKLYTDKGTAAGKQHIKALLRQYPKQYKPVADASSAGNDDTSGYRNPVSASVIGGVAAVCLIAGIIMLLIGIFSSAAGHEVLLYVGSGSIVTSALLFVIMNMSVDIHRMDANLEMLASENARFRKDLLKLLKEIKAGQNNQGNP